MALVSGTTLGPYEVVGPLGSGGMGEVYRSRDTRLGRQVALKLLLPDQAADGERLQRFRQEAEAAGLLNHPNVVAVFDVGTHDGAPYVVSELLEGQTLRERLGPGALDARTALDHALQVAGGLAAAHARGIVHRDLKPENVFITREGVVKLLDFGLATVGARPAGPPGAVLGTAGYMSPEQARGRPSDARSDVFGFGAVLYEMVTGQRAFRGASALESMSAVLREDPPWPRELPAPAGALLEVARRCLRKDPRRRYASGEDVLCALRALATAAPAPSRRRRRRWVLLAPVAVSAALAAGYLAGARTGGGAAPTLQRLTFRRGVVSAARFHDASGEVVYSAQWDGGPSELYAADPRSARMRALGTGHLLALSRTGEMALLVRPRQVRGSVYTGTMARAPLAGGQARELLDDVHAADWSPDGTELAVVREVDGSARVEFPPGRVLFQTAGDVSSLRVSPDGRHVAFVELPLRADGAGALAVVDRAGHARTLSAGWLSIAGLAWAPSGREVWFTATRGGARRALWAATLDGQERLVQQTLGTLTLHDAAGERLLLAREDLRRETMVRAGPDAAERSLTWLDWTRASDVSPDGRLVLFTEMGEDGRAAAYYRALDGAPAVRLGQGIATEFSPDGRSVLAVQPGRPAQLAVLSLAGGAARPLTADDINHQWASWVPGGKEIVFSGNREGHGVRLYAQPVAGRTPRALSPEGVGAAWHPVSPDGRRVAAVGPDGRLALFPLHGGAPAAVPGALRQDRPFRFSADGRALMVFEEGAVPATVARLDLASGRREPLLQLMPEEAAGVMQVHPTFLSPDARRYVYTYRRVLSDLYLAEGMR
jgi:Tol biopolymer transport system component